MQNKSLLLPLIYLIFLNLNLFGQTKYEREFRVNKQDVPINAIIFIQSSFPDCKIKWYIEESQDGKTFEAKTKFKSHKFSVEFDTLGKVLDVEKTIKFETLDSITKGSIDKSLGDEFVFSKIVKVQIQWKADDITLQELIVNRSSENQFSQNYELSVKAKKEDMLKYYEVLLDSSGNIIRISEIIQRSTSNLDY